MDKLQSKPVAKVLNVADMKSETLNNIGNSKLRNLATGIKSGEVKSPSAGHLNYFKTASNL